MTNAKPRERSNSSVDEEIVNRGACGLVHLPTGRTCARPARHRGGCEFVPRDELSERGLSPEPSQHVVNHFGEPVEILLVEDQPAHVRLTQEALDEAGMVNVLHVVEEAEAALAFLRHEGPYTAAPRPGLILLDVYLPGRSGLDVLAEVKADAELRDIPVAVLTSSTDGGDVRQAYGLGATCFVTKPVRYAEFVQAVRDLGRFWFTTVTLPRPDREPVPSP